MRKIRKYKYTHKKRLLEYTWEVPEGTKGEVTAAVGT